MLAQRYIEKHGDAHAEGSPEDRQGLPGHRRQARQAQPRRAFHQRLMQHRTPFIVAELGADTDSFMLHIYAALAEKSAG